jgi:hypothetical protein
VKAFRILVMTAILAGIVRASPAREARRPLKVMDFETGNLDQWPRKKLPSRNSARVVTNPVRAGRYSAEFILRRSDPMVSEGKRCELQVDDIGEIGGEYWYGFSTLIPEDWQADTRAGEVVAQWKGRPDTELGESESRSPSLALRVAGDKWRITVQADPNPVTRDNGAPRTTLWRGKLGRGAWTDWVFRIRWSYGKDGLLEIWKDGGKIAVVAGPNANNDKGKIYFKIGLYKPSWNDPAAPSDVDTRRLYHDEVRIGGATARYEDVSPPSRAKAASRETKER